MAMAQRIIKNGNKNSPPKLGVGVVKVIVIGESLVGKSTFIRAYYGLNEPGEIYSHNGVKVYPCEFYYDGSYKRAAIFEIPGDPEFFKELRTPHYENAKVIVMMYSIDDPFSHNQLTDKWLPEAKDAILLKGIPVVLLGNKVDLRHNQQVIEGLALVDSKPVTYEEGEDLLVYQEIGYFTEMSANRLEDVNHAFEVIFYALGEGVHNAEVVSD